MQFTVNKFYRNTHGFNKQPLKRVRYTAMTDKGNVKGYEDTHEATMGTWKEGDSVEIEVEAKSFKGTEWFEVVGSAPITASGPANDELLNQLGALNVKVDKILEFIVTMKMVNNSEEDGVPF